MTNLTWQRMLDKITAIVRQHGALAAATEHKQTILSHLEKYRPNEGDYQAYKHFDASGYTKNLVRDINDGESNVIIMCWAAGQSSAFHAHEGSRCFVKVLYGQLREQQVPYPTQLKDETQNLRSQDAILNARDVTYIDDSIGLHKVTNMSSTNPAITLHIYMPAYRNCRIFDTETHQVPTLLGSKSTRVTFDSIHGELINQQ